MCISHFTLGHSLNLKGEWACKSTMLPAMGENHSCFSEGFCREVLLSQCAGGLNGFQLLAEVRVQT